MDDNNDHSWTADMWLGGWQGIALASTIAVITSIALSKQRRQAHADNIMRPFKEENLAGKTIVITGANRGIGLATAEILASHKGQPHVILGCRAMDSCQEAAKSLRASTGNPNITPLELDLTNFQSIESFAKEIKTCNILINNASQMSPHRVFKHGIELTMLTNHIGPIFLSMLMLPTLQQTARQSNESTRIINVGSRLEKTASIPLSDQQPFNLRWLQHGPLQEPFSPWAAYSNSKLSTLLSSLALSSKSSEIESSIVTINTVTPGIVYTDLGRWAPLWQRILAGPIMAAVLRTPYQGAASVVHAALSPSLSNKSGRFYYDGQEIQPSLRAQNRQLATAVHAETEELIRQLRGNQQPHPLQQ